VYAIQSLFVCVTVTCMLYRVGIYVREGKVYAIQSRYNVCYFPAVSWRR
jgi:hypothetical protein